MPDRETLRFARAILDRPYKFTIAFLIANVFIFMLMWDSNGLTSQTLWSGFSFPVLIVYGAKLNELIAGPHHEWWRFVTPMFLHVNLIHLLVNMYSLWIIGPYVEKLYGSAKFVVFWVLSGIAGVVASYLTVRPDLATTAFTRFLFKVADEPSAGASGALFGLVGVLFVFGIKFRHELPEGFKRAFGTGLLPTIFINVFIGYLGRGFIDNAAHMGGLAAGALLALMVQYRRPGESQGSAFTWRALQLVSLAVVLICFGKVAQHFNRARTPPPASQAEVVLNYLSVMNHAQETIAMVVMDGDFSTVPRTVAQLNGVAAPDQTAEELRQRLIALLTKVYPAPTPSPSSTPVESPSATPTPVASPSLSPVASPKPSPTSEGPVQKQPDKKLIEAFREWNRDYENWLKSIKPILNQ